MSTTERERQARWAMSIHEAGHAVAAYLLLRDGAAAAALAADSLDGVTVFNREAGDGFERAMVIAAGPAGEALAAHLPVPELPAAVAAPAVAIDASHCAEIEAAHLVTSPIKLRTTVPTDERQLALWAIGGFEDRPERWAGRIAWVRSCADRFTRNHAQSIAAVARVIFTAGTVLVRDVLPPLPPLPPPPVDDPGEGEPSPTLPRIQP